MEIRPIKTEKDYNSALSRIDKFWKGQSKTNVAYTE
jgi:antitoxin component HigA of HigAB toxin-antitoxin module